MGPRRHRTSRHFQGIGLQSNWDTLGSFSQSGARVSFVAVAVRRAAAARRAHYFVRFYPAAGIAVCMRKISTKITPYQVAGSSHVFCCYRGFLPEAMPTGLVEPLSVCVCVT